MRYTICSRQTLGRASVQLPSFTFRTRCLVLLHIALQEGFHHDDVRVLVDAREVLANADVTTRRQTGYAASVDVDVMRSPVMVEVVLSKRGITHKNSVPVDRPTYVGLSLTPEGTLAWKTSHEPFGYL